MQLTTEIINLRPYLFSIAYNMLGVIEEAEDIVQSVYEKWIDAQQVNNAKAYLGRIAVNQSITRLNEIKKLRESYTGPWLPEPYITLEQVDTPTIEYGLLFLLERLNPVERAVFILRESFSEEYSSIAEFTGESADNCRQLLHRGHQKLERKTTQPVDPAKQRMFTEAFLTALQNQDRSALEQVLQKDIELYSDGGGKRAAAIRPLVGFEAVTRFLLGIMKLTQNHNGEFEYRPAFVNGVPAALVYKRSTGELDSMQYVEFDHNGVFRLLAMRNPDKLHVRTP